MGAPLSGLFGKKPEPAAKKPKFVRSPKPKADVVPAPAVNQAEVKLEEQPAVSPIPQIIAESSIAPDLKTPDKSAPAITEIPVFSVESPAAEPSPPPAELASNFTPLPPPLEFSEIAAPPTVEPAEPQPEAKKQAEDDNFDEMWRSMAKDSQSDASSAAPTATATAAPTANPTPAKTAKKSGGFGSLFGNIKNSLGGMLGRGAGKNKSDANAPVTTAKVDREPIAPESKITAIPAPDIDVILESELAAAAAEVAAETSNTAVETSQGVPFPTDVEAMAELIAAESASSAKIGESSIEERSSAETQTTPLAQEAPAAEVDEPTEDAAVPEAEAPAVSIEMTVVEIAEPVEIEVPGEPGLSVQVETVSVSVITIESTEQKPSSDGEQPDLVETAKPAAESKSENVSGEDKPFS